MKLNIFETLEQLNQKPGVYSAYTAQELWNDAYTSRQMLGYHLNAEVDLSSRNHLFIDESVQWITSHFNIHSNSRIADFGCGPGLYCQRLAQRGANVTGIDFSSSSITYAREMAQNEDLGIHYVNQNYLKFESSEKYDLIIMIMCDFCALSPHQRALLLQKFRKLLKPTGSVLLDVYSLVAFESKKEGASYEKNQLNGFWSADSYYGFLNSYKYLEECVSLDQYSIFEVNRIRTIYNWLQYFSPELLQYEFAENGFKVDQILGNVAGSPFEVNAHEFAIVASIL